MTGRRLSPGERALWRRAMRDVRRAAHRLPASPSPPRDDAPALPQKELRRPAAAPAPTVAAKAGLSVFASGDPGLERRARRGRLRPERAIDLHGLTQGQAHAALVRFIDKARADGCRCVLVVTGKGSGARLDPFTERAPRGVIRMRFREWVHEPGLRSAIARVSPAHKRDGGAGAFYVFLKRKAGAQS